MEFWSSVQVIIRRWYVVVICGLVAMALAVVIIHQVKPSYQAAGKVTILQTGEPTSPNSSLSNPWGAANVFTAAVADAAGSQSFQDQLVAKGASPIYTVAPSINNTPTLVISTTAKTPSGATTSFQTLTKLLQQKIQQMQASVNTPKSTLYSGVVLTAPSGATQLLGSRVKALILLGVVGLVATLGLVFLVDALLEARDRRQMALTASTAQDDVISLDEILDMDAALRTEDQPRSSTEPTPWRGRFETVERRGEAAGS